MDEIYKSDFNRAVEDYLLSSYKYYILYEDTGFSDDYYDYLCKFLLTNLHQIISPYIHLLDEDLLRSGSGFSIKEEDYPIEIKGRTY